MSVRKFCRKCLFPLLLVLLTILAVYPFCVENGRCDYRMLWIIAGIPFGIHRIHIWMVPRGFDIGGTVGVLVLNLLLGGIIGGAVLAVQICVSAAYLVKGMAMGIYFIVNRCRTK